MKKILIIDDDPRSIAALAIRLRAAGYHVSTAADGLDGLKQAIHKRPDLIVMDLWMPDGAGVLTAQRLKHVGLADVPVVFLTAGRKDNLWHIVEEVGPAGFFEKPCDPRELLGAINTLLACGSVPLPANVPDPRLFGANPL
jgi:DNA-binding response OmpR family regulator